LRRGEFERNAFRINQYLEWWNCAGFRAAFMLGNLGWIHELKVQYDTSTFDTDPFEPQPQGQGTIFPFWVARGTPTPTAGSSEGGAGYVELPYTLAQDSTLFLTLGEREPTIWLEKLDWVAEHGGMALVDAHPDYMRFQGDAVSRRTYPVELYERLLEHVRSRHAGAYWPALPEEVATWVRSAHAGGGGGTPGPNGPVAAPLSGIAAGVAGPRASR
jgi:hypothetical protein